MLYEEQAKEVLNAIRKVYIINCEDSLNCDNCPFEDNCGRLSEIYEEIKEKIKYIKKKYMDELDAG